MIREQFLTNTAYGFPKGALRRVNPVVIACLHITGNPQNLGADAAQRERNYANRPLSNGPSAHVYLDRDGSGIEAIPTQYAAWSNGDLKAPVRRIVANVLAMTASAKGYNANEAYWIEIEMVGAPNVAPVTDAQLETVAGLIAQGSKATGLPINRHTVHVHADLNSVDRPNDPFPAATRERQLAALIARAQQIREHTMSIDLTEPSNDTATLLRQWLAVHGGTAAPAGSYFAANKADDDREIVELTAGIAALGTAYYAAGSITPSVLRLARKLNAGNRFALTPDFLAALLTGQPVLALKYGVASQSAVASTGPGSV